MSLTRGSSFLRIGAICSALFFAGCHEGNPYVSQRVQTLEVTLAAGTELGTSANPNASRTLNLRIEAKDRDGLRATDFTGKIQTYVYYLGTLSPTRGSGANSLQEIQVTNGVAENITVNVPLAFGPSSLWFEDVGETGATVRASTFAAGATPTLWYRDPYISDIQTPPVQASNPSASPANYRSILEGKQVRIHESQHGANGRLVVTSIQTQAYTVTDVACAAGGEPPCTQSPFGSLYVFTFGKPPAGIEVGTVLTDITGGVSEFTGFTELGFPRQIPARDSNNSVIVRTDLLPSPFRVVTQAFLAQHTQQEIAAHPEWTLATDNRKMEGVESAIVELRSDDKMTVRVCAPTDAADLDRWISFGQFELDIGSGCGNGPSIATKPMSNFDPTMNNGLVLSRVVGWVRNVAGVSRTSGNDFSFFTVTIRDQNDLECQARGCRGM